MDSIFSNLPNDLIMKIIKTAEDERKKEELNQHKLKFRFVLFNLLDVERHMLEYYEQDERDMGGDLVMTDVFWTIKNFNEELKQEEEYYEELKQQQ
jgi:hypothetical protein